MSDGEGARLATSERPVDSPSGDFRLGLAEGEYSGDDGSGAFRRIQIRDGSGHLVHDSPKRFSARFTTDVLWDDDIDRVWVYSSDVGTFYWDRGADGEWIMRSLRPVEIAAGKPSPPDAIVERHQNVFGPEGRAKARAVAERQRGVTDGPATAEDDPRLMP